MEPIEILLDSSRRYESIREIESDGESINTCLLDIEAASLCGGISNSPKARQIWKNYFNGNITKQELFFAHKIGMKLVDKYGVAFVQYCLTLPPLPFKYGDVSQIYSVMDQAKKKLENPVLRYVSSENDRFVRLEISQSNGLMDLYVYKELGKPDFFTGKREEKHRFSLTFFTVKTDHNRSHVDTNILTLKNLTTGSRIAKIHRSGIIESYNDKMLKSSAISLFLKFNENTKTMSINYGFTTGECSYCGRELSDKSSLKYGYGKICAKNYGLPYS